MQYHARDMTATGGRSEGHSREPVSLFDLRTTARPLAAIPLVHTHHAGTDRGSLDTGSPSPSHGKIFRLIDIFRQSLLLGGRISFAYLLHKCRELWLDFVPPC